MALFDIFKSSEQLVIDEEIRSANKGHTPSMIALGDRYFIGSDTQPQDIRQAAYWYEKAADLNDNIGQFKLGCILFYDEKSNVNDKAILLLISSFRNGNSEAAC